AAGAGGHAGKRPLRPPAGRPRGEDGAVPRRGNAGGGVRSDGGAVRRPHGILSTIPHGPQWARHAGGLQPGQQARGGPLPAGCGREAGRAAEDNRVQVWDVASGREKAVFLGHTAGVWGIVFSPDGKRLYSAGEDGVLRVWDVAARTSLPPFAGPSLSMKTLA